MRFLDVFGFDMPLHCPIGLLFDVLETNLADLLDFQQLGSESISMTLTIYSDPSRALLYHCMLVYRLWISL